MSVEVSKLPSGLTVITDTMPHLETAALGVWAGVGGRDEKPDEHGISHLLEHMAFKGTERRSSREIVEEIEAVGGDHEHAHIRQPGGQIGHGKSPWEPAPQPTTQRRRSGTKR